MNLRTLVPAMLTAFAFAACSGAGSGPVANGPPPLSAAPASGTLTIIRTAAVSGAKNIDRRPAFVSSSTTHAALFIDSVAAAVGSSTSCASGCTITYSAAAGSHTFAAEIDNGTTVLAEGAHVALTLVPGTGNNFTMTLNGAAGEGAWMSDTGSTSGTISGTYAVADATGVPITSPGSVFDNGALTLTANTLTGTPGATVSAGATLSGPNGVGTTYTDTVACGVGDSGTFSITIAAAGGTPEVTVGQLATIAGVSYPANALAISTWPVYTCTAGVISDASGGGTIN